LCGNTSSSKRFNKIKGWLSVHFRQSNGTSIIDYGEGGVVTLFRSLSNRWECGRTQFPSNTHALREIGDLKGGDKSQRKLKNNIAHWNPDIEREMWQCANKLTISGRQLADYRAVNKLKFSDLATIAIADDSGRPASLKKEGLKINVSLYPASANASSVMPLLLLSRRAEWLS